MGETISTIADPTQEAADIRRLAQAGTGTGDIVISDAAAVRAINLILETGMDIADQSVTVLLGLINRPQPTSNEDN